MPAHATYRARILQHLAKVDGFITAREIAEVLNLPCKAVQDALNALWNYELVSRTGRKFSARWGARRPDVSPSAWESLSAVWFGPNVKAGKEGGGSKAGPFHGASK